MKWDEKAHLKVLREIIRHGFGTIHLEIYQQGGETFVRPDYTKKDKLIVAKDIDED